MRIISFVFLIVLYSCSKGGGSLPGSPVAEIPKVNPDGTVIPPVVEELPDIIVNCSQEKSNTTPFHAKGRRNQLDYYLICNANELSHINDSTETLGYTYSLGADIELYGYYTGDYLVQPTNQFMIGSYPLNPFTGNFNANGYSISNFRYNNESATYCGLFSYIKNANIRGLYLENVRIDGGSGKCGTLVGRAENSILQYNFNVYGEVSQLPESQWNYIKGDQISGLVGYLIDSSIMYSYSVANMESTNISNARLGGLVLHSEGNSFLGYSFFDGTVIAGDITKGAIYAELPTDRPNLDISGSDVAFQIRYSSNKGLVNGCYQDINCSSDSVSGIDVSINTDYFFNQINIPLNYFNQSMWEFSPNFYPILQ